MQATNRIDAIERRAAGLNLSLWRVAKLAGVEYSNLSRWRRGEASPTMHLYDDVMTSLEGKLTELEACMLERLLAAKAPPPHRPAA